MTWKQAPTPRRWIHRILGLLLVASAVACSARPPAAPPPKSETVADRPKEVASEAAGLAVTPTEPSSTPRPTANLPPPPFTEQEIEALWMQPELASEEYGVRLEAVRSILHRLRSRGQVEEAKVALMVLVDEVEKEEGLAMAQRAAFAEANNLESQQDYRAAVMAYQWLLDRYPGGTFAAEACYHLGGVQLELHDYPAAEQAWRCLIQQHDDSSFAPWGWRKLALAELLQGQFDGSLATLAMMAAKYPETEFEDYARMRKGYVLVAAGRTAEARAAYQAFLAEYPHSSYRRLVVQQLAALDEGETDQAKVLARVNGPRE